MYTNPKISASLALASLISNLLVPSSGYNSIDLNSVEEVHESLTTLHGQALIQSSVPDIPVVKYSSWVLTTAYSSTVDQTDSTPFITASGTRVRDGVIACNFLRFGTRVRFPELYGDKVFVVEDRMARKNDHKIDIWFASRNQAKQFGIKQIKIEVLEA
ncbi:MAG: 3D domain-containing protein [Candidatus Portnoybacteria bacterium]|nr:3D domain-containing protein [Candidatus Portnoybacteria bacterium]